MKIALAKVSSYQSWYKVPSFALGYLTAVLESGGIEARIFDGRYYNIGDEQLVKEICDFHPDILGLSAMTHEINRVALVAQAVKSKLNIPIAVGGCHLTALPVETMREFPVIDYGVVGEGEYALRDIVEYLSGNMAIESIDGVIYRKGADILQNNPRTPIADLDSIPFPAFQQYYKEGNKSLANQWPYPVLTNRGCMFNCAFCMRVLGHTVRARSDDNILSELDMAISKYGARYINFADEIFLFNNERTKGLLRKFIEKGYAQKVRWSGLTRVNFVDDEIISLAKKAGCNRLEMGVESGNDQILRNTNKNITIVQIENAVRIIKRHKIKVASYYILGHPGETESTIKDTIALAARLNTETIAVGIMVPYPGTKIYEWAKENKFGYKLLSQDWSRYDKYGGTALEIAGLPLEKMESFQRKAYLYFYLRNLRIFDLIKFAFSRYKGIFQVLFKK